MVLVITFIFSNERSIDQIETYLPYKIKQFNLIKQLKQIWCNEILRVGVARKTINNTTKFIIIQNMSSRRNKTKRCPSMHVLVSDTLCNTNTNINWINFMQFMTTNLCFWYFCDKQNDVALCMIWSNELYSKVHPYNGWYRTYQHKPNDTQIQHQKQLQWNKIKCSSVNVSESER